MKTVMIEIAEGTDDIVNLCNSTGLHLNAGNRAAAPMQEPPTFMGEPVVMSNAEVTGGPLAARPVD